MQVVNSYTSFPGSVTSLALDALSTGAKATYKGVFACKLVIGAYAGYCFRLGNSGNTKSEDFYADSTGNLTSSGNLTSGTAGQSLATWTTSQSFTGLYYVYTWYDQSGNGTAAQSLISNCPVYDSTNKLVDFRSSVTGVTTSHLVFGSPNIVSGDGAYTMAVRHGLTTSTGWNGYVGAGQSISNDCYYISSVNNANYQAGHWNNDTGLIAGTGIASGNKLCMTYNGGGSSGVITLYVNGSSLGTKVPTAVRNTAGNFGWIGAGQLTSGAGPYAQAQIYNVTLFNSVLSAGDRTIVDGQ